jgi:hypothetical protein
MSCRDGKSREVTEKSYSKFHFFPAADASTLCEKGIALTAHSQTIEKPYDPLPLAERAGHINKYIDFQGEYTSLAICSKRGCIAIWFDTNMPERR